MTTSAITLILLFAGLLLFQLTLAAGAPFGKLAWGGQHGRILPTKLRIGSFFSALFFLFCILMVLIVEDQISIVSLGFATNFLRVAAGYSAIGTLINLISKSKYERLWSPYSFALCMLCIAVV